MTVPDLETASYGELKVLNFIGRTREQELEGFCHSIERGQGKKQSFYRCGGSEHWDLRLGAAHGCTGKTTLIEFTELSPHLNSPGRIGEHCGQGSGKLRDRSLATVARKKPQHALWIWKLANQWVSLQWTQSQSHIELNCFVSAKRGEWRLRVSGVLTVCSPRVCGMFVDYFGNLARARWGIALLVTHLKVMYCWSSQVEPSSRSVHEQNTPITGTKVNLT